MKKLTKKQRLELYKEALKYWEKLNYGTWDCFCHYFRKAIARKFKVTVLELDESEYDVYHHENFEKILPELYSTKPESHFAYWFLPIEHSKRIECLEKAIELIQKK